MKFLDHLYEKNVTWDRKVAVILTFSHPEKNIKMLKGQLLLQACSLHHQIGCLLIAGYIEQSLLFFFFYVQLIRSFLKGVKRYLAILFFRSNFHYISFSLTFKNDFALFHVACGLAAGVSKHTAVPQDEIRLTLHVIKQRTQIFAKEMWPCRREQMPTYY